MVYENSDGRGPGNRSGSGGQYGLDAPGDSPIRTACPEALFDWDDIPPDIGPYVLADDLLQVTLAGNGSSTAIINYAVLTRDNGIVLGQERFTNTGTNSGSTQSFQLREGFLLSVTVVPSANLGTGAYLWATVGIRRLTQTRQNIYQVLCQGYTYALAPLTFPQSPVKVPSDGGGCVRVISGATPAAGADISESVPSAVRWQLLSLRATLTTSAAVANRQVGLTLDDSTNRFYDSAQGPAQAASLAWAYTFAPLGVAQVQTNTQVSIQTPADFPLEAQFRIRTVTLAIQAADQWSGLFYLVREWQGQQ